MKSAKLLVLPACLVILFFLVAFPVPVHADLTTGTLAEAMGTIIGATNWNPSASASDLNVYNIPHYAEVFCMGDPSYYQTAASIEAGSPYPYQVLQVARLAQIDGYSTVVSSATISSYTSTAPWVGSLPNNWNSGYFLIYERFMAYAWNNGYWSNAAAAASQIDNIVATVHPYGGAGPGTFIAYNTVSGYPTYYRYYDDTAETIEFLLQLQGGADSATCDNIWAFQNTYFWNGQYYGYNGQSGMETEVGPFALISGRYLQTAGTFSTYANRIVSDLNQKLVINGYSSPLWGHYSLNHVPGVDERRLENAAAAWAALQAYFPVMTSAMQNTLQTQMLGTGWKGFLSQSGDFYPAANQFGWRNDGVYSVGADGPGLMYLFFNGIVPQTGSLAVPLEDESYQDSSAWAPASMFRFNYAQHWIRIPVNRGTINFEFGTGVASYNFPQNGVYTVQFSSDWNTVQSATYYSSLDPQFKYVSGSAPPAQTGSVDVHATLNGSPESGVAISYSGPSSGTASTGSDGTYTVTNLDVGTYSFATTCNGIQQTNSSVIVSNGAITNVYFAFTSTPPGTGSIYVNAVDQSGNGLSATATLTGPSTDLSHAVPYTFTDLAYAAYSVTITFNGSSQNTAVTLSSSQTTGNIVDTFNTGSGGGGGGIMPLEEYIFIGGAAGGLGCVVLVAMHFKGPAQAMQVMKKKRHRTRRG